MTSHNKQDLRNTLGSLVNRYGVRGVVNCLADICEEAAAEERSLPYDTLKAPGETVDPSDLDQASGYLKGDMY